MGRDSFSQISAFCRRLVRVSGFGQFSRQERQFQLSEPQQIIPAVAPLGIDDLLAMEIPRAKCCLTPFFPSKA
jgi:hypothetical protein